MVKKHKERYFIWTSEFNWPKIWYILQREFNFNRAFVCCLKQYKGTKNQNF